MIIFGTRGIRTTKEKGNFQCPQCDTSTPYKHKKVTKFFTLYFIPIIPLGSAGEYVECTRCKGTFIPRVLEMGNSEEQFMSNYEQAIKHSMVKIMLADGVIDDNEKTTVHEIINKFSHNDITMTELEAYVEKVKNDQEPIATYLSKVGATLNEHGKEVLIKCALAVAASDGHMDETELTEIMHMGTALQMSNSHLKGILMEMQSAPEAVN